MNKEVIITLIFNLILFIIAMIIFYLKSYSSERGRNLARKKDIAEITEKIETVKNEIGIHSQMKLAYLNDRKKAALDFLSSVSVWLDFTLRPMDRLYNNTLDIDLLKEILLDLKNKGSESTSFYWNISVYFDSETFLDAVDKLYLSCIDLHNKTHKFILDLERQATHRNDYLKRLSTARDREIAIELNKKIDVLDKKTQNIVNSYTSERKDIEDEATKYRLTYIIVLNKVLKVNKPSP
jgi:hypothetical protein